ncbi:glycoside hydrolase superfamily, partial [Absidia repens]
MPLVLFPPLQSRLLKRQNQLAHFFVWTDLPHLSSIELWSNLNAHKTWHSQYFTSVAAAHEGWYQLTLPLLQPCGTYEYTLKYWQNGQEVWLGSAFENGVVSLLASINEPSTIQPSPLDLTNIGHFLTPLDSHHHQHASYWSYKIKKKIGQHRSPLMVVNQMQSYMALARKSSCWLAPVSGSTHFEHDARPWQLLIYRDKLDGSTSAWMVRTCKNQDSWLHVNTANSILELHTFIEEDNDKRNTMYLVGGRTYDTSDNAIKTMISTIMTPLMKQQQQQQQQQEYDSNDTHGSVVMNEYLGYCTWNSLDQQDMTMDGIDNALDSFEQHHIPIGYLLIDDGWQRQHDGYMTDFDADPRKFPDGLSGTIKSLKRRHRSLKSIGVWHTLWGYWCGVDKDSIGKLYQQFRSYYSSSSETLLEGDTKVYLIVDGVSQFYDDFYRHLTDAGVDMVKIDNQGGIGDLRWECDAQSTVKRPISLKQKHRLWDMYRVAAANAMEKYFTTPPLHCMAMNPHLLECRKLETEKITKIWYGGINRNSDDFYPDIFDSHPWHLYENLLNSMWSSSLFSAIDFDMFQSAHYFGEYHASSRAISGGPVYITDIPGNHDINLLRTLTAENRDGSNQILRCRQACWPLYDTVLGGKPGIDQNFIGAWNTIGTFGFVYGYWNTRKESQCIATTPIPLGYVGYVSLGLDVGKWLYNLESKDDLPLAFRLDVYGCSMVRVVPVYHYQPSLHSTGIISCIGLLDKLNGLQSVVHAEIVLSSQQLYLIQPRLAEYGRVCLFKTHISHRSSQCGFLLSSFNAATILWASLDGVDVQLEKRRSRDPASPITKQAELWILDMTQIPLTASNTTYFSIEIYINY